MYSEFDCLKCPNMAFYKTKLNSPKYQTIINLSIFYCLLLLVQVNGKEIDSKTDLLQEESLAAEHRSYDRAHHHRKHSSQSQTHYNDDYSLTTSNNSSWPASKPEVSQIKQLNVKCEKNHMRVHIEFDRPFYGLIFSKGYYNDAKCVHLPAGSGHLTTNFDILLGACGMTSSGANQGQLIQQPGQTSGLYIENTVVIQYDPQVQEIWDQARKLRCTWSKWAKGLGQVKAIAGIVKIGQTMTMVLAIKDEENKFDMLVRNCIAHDGKHQPIQLVDEFGCVVRSKIMSKFQKVKNFGNSATVVSYAYFQAFKFPDTMNVHFQCVIQVCRYECPEPVCDGGQGEIQAAAASSSTSPNNIQHLLTAATQLQADYANSASVSKDAGSNIVMGKVLAGTSGASPVFPANLLLSRSGELKTSEIGDNNIQQQQTSTDGGKSSDVNLSVAQRQFATLFSNAKPRSLKSTENANYTGSQNLTAKLSEKGQLKLRSRRHAQFKNVQTEKMIQVVAPGDVAFAADIAVPLEGNDEFLMSEELRSSEWCIYQVNGKEIDSKTDLLQEESLAAEHRSYDRAHHHRKHSSQSQTHYNDDYSLTTSNNSSWPASKPEVSQIKQLNVKCEKNHMRVHIEFDRPFYGLIFSKGYYNDAKCVHLPAGSGHLTTNFDILLGACGMTSSGANQGQLIQQPGQTSGLYIENTVVIQYDPQVQEIWDQARKLRCTWSKWAKGLGQVKAIAGIVKIGQTMTMVLAIKDEENKFDMLVRNCIAHDGKHQPIQLVDEFGCVVRSKIMSKFQKVKNFGNSATVVSYAYFQAFKFPDTMNVHFQCVIQVCRYECPEPVCDGGQGEIQAAAASSSTSPNNIQHLLTAATQLQADYANSASVSKDAGSNIVMGKVLAGTSGASPVFPANLLLSRSGELKTSEIGDNNIQQQQTSTDGGKSSDVNLSVAQRQFATLFSNAKPRSLKSTENANYTGSQNLTAKLSEKGQLKLRSRRHAQFKNVQTEKMIQVVAPGDVAFAADIAVPLEGNDEFLMSEELRSRSVCLSTVSFASGLLVLLCLLVVSSLVATFLYLRIRQISLTFPKQQYIPNNTLIFH